MDESEELQQLRQRVTELETELQQARTAPSVATPSEPGPRAPERTRWRSVVAATCIGLACVLAPLSVTAVWASDEVSDTDRYVETVAPLAEDPAIQNAVADAVTEEIFTYVDVEAITSEALAALAAQDIAPRAAAGLEALQVPIVNGIEGFTRTEVGKVLASPQFATVWEQANRAAHTELVNLLSGEQGGAVSAQNGTVTLNLGPIVAAVKQQLIAEGYTIANNIPAVDRSIVLVSSDAVTKAQGVYRLLDGLGRWLPVIALALFAVGVYVATGHRRALLLGSLGVAGSMLLLGVALAVARPLYLDAIPSDVLPREAAGNIFDTLVRFLRNGLRVTAVLALVVALGAFFTGPSTTAARTRRGLAETVGVLGGRAEAAGVRTGGVGTWTAAHRRPLRIGLVIAGALVLTFWSRPTVGVVLWTAVAVLVGIGVVEFLARTGTPEPRAAVAGEGAAGAPATTPYPAPGEPAAEAPTAPLPRQREPVTPGAPSPATPSGEGSETQVEKEASPHG